MGQREEGREQKAEGRMQRAEGRGQRAEGRGQRAECRGQRGFKDKKYRERRTYFVKCASGYKHDTPIPRVIFTEEETQTWNLVFKELKNLYPSHACKEYVENLKMLCEEGIYKIGEIPQLADISRVLKERTGFQLRPVAGYLSPRNFLAGLAFRVFHCTQYIRHASDPLYTPEPDSIHELLGHVPLLADRSFAQFSQEIGLASLGASDDDVAKLASCYFFTVEFGLCKQDGQLRAYGAGLLSSISELQFATSSRALVKPFNPSDVIKQECKITTFQDSYFVSQSFTAAKRQIREYTTSILRPFGVRYDPYTQSVDVIKNSNEIMTAVDELKDDLGLLNDTLTKLQSL
ncbi:putative tryptophan 5-hydroxylase 1 [Apostichopus japonicus]|uniref:Putative tryptophan 5-hydroxylase 1 n=1 Tax=Stichopus japonicus TaxID=307972 RepID=A0A2G8KB05_STIJA|nr:putative tryptophan 5-hydroxylase 1 [Apostichopus japonicus]